MKNTYSLLFLSLLWVVVSCGPQSVDTSSLSNPIFDSTYNEIATSVAARDINQALAAADSLLQITENSFQQMKALMLKASIHQRNGAIAEALAHATWADRIAEDERYNDWQVRIAGFLSTTYRWVNLPNEARKYLSKAEKANSRLKDSKGYHVTQLLLHQERAYYEIEEDQDFKEAIQELNKAVEHCKQLPDNHPSVYVFRATNNQLLGLSYYHLKEYELSKAYYNKALAQLKMGQSGIEPFIWCGLGDVEVELGNPDDAVDYYEKAEASMRNSDLFAGKVVLNRSLSRYYRSVNDQEKALKHQGQYLQLLKEKNNSAKQISNDVVMLLNQEKDQNTIINSVFLFTILILSVGLVVLTVYYSLVKRRDTNRYKQLQEVMSKGETSAKYGSTIPAHNGSQIERKDFLISKETENRLTQGLLKLESEGFYLDTAISLSILATKLNTNNKYMSYVIKKYSGMDFNDYINNLRVQKFLTDLSGDTKLLSYKIAYLAEMYGFSSHTNFTTVFKGITGMSPSAFISRHTKDIQSHQE